MARSEKSTIILREEEMHKKNALTLIKKIASILLVVCFVLPLSRCTPKAPPEGQISADTTYTYGFEIAQEGWNDIKAKKADGMVNLLAVIVVFFLPIVCLSLNERLQAPIYFFSTFVAAFFLFIWVFLFKTSAEIGGIIAIACWTLLFFASNVTIFDLWRSKRLFKRRAARRVHFRGNADGA
jgi:hypothetical protein